MAIPELYDLSPNRCVNYAIRRETPDYIPSSNTDYSHPDNVLPDALLPVHADAIRCNVCTKQPIAPHRRIRFLLRVGRVRPSRSRRNRQLGLSLIGVASSFSGIRTGSGASTGLGTGEGTMIGRLGLLRDMFSTVRRQLDRHQHKRKVTK